MMHSCRAVYFVTLIETFQITPDIRLRIALTTYLMLVVFDRSFRNLKMLLVCQFLANMRI